EHNCLAVREGQPQHSDRRLVEAGDAVEQGGFAGTVRSDQRIDVAAGRQAAQGLNRYQTPEPHGQVLDGQDRLRRAGIHPAPSVTRSLDTDLRSLRKTEGWRVPIRPRGRHTMIATMASPNTSMRYCSKPRNSSKALSITSAAMATPSCEPMPPRTTMA